MKTAKKILFELLGAREYDNSIIEYAFRNEIDVMIRFDGNHYSGKIFHFDYDKITLAWNFMHEDKKRVKPMNFKIFERKNIMIEMNFPASFYDDEEIKT